jgi:CheY-like chemotaxis protein
MLEPKPPYILYADDDPDDSMLFSEAVSQLDVKVSLDIVEDGLSVINHLERKLPDIIFLDLNMPRKNGKECLHLIRSNKKFSNVPVIIYSTSSAKADIDECYEAGANFYVIKPFHFSDIIATLKKIFGINWKTKFVIPSKQQFVIKS